MFELCDQGENGGTSAGHVVVEPAEIDDGRWVVHIILCQMKQRQTDREKGSFVLHSSDRPLEYGLTV